MLMPMLMHAKDKEKGDGIDNECEMQKKNKRQANHDRICDRPCKEERTQRFANFLGSWRISWASYDNHNSCGFIHGYMLVPAGTATLPLLLTTMMMFFLPISHCLRSSLPLFGFWSV